MAGELDGYDDRSRLRISDADRHRVAELLREAAGEGRLDIDELDERLEAAYAAKTYGDLVPLTADLPLGAQHHPLADAPPAGPPGVPAIRYDTSVAIMGGTSRKGLWEVGPTHTAFAIMGGVEMDLRQARFTTRETVIRAFGIWSGIDIYVNAYTRVIVDGVGDHGGLRPGPRQGAARAGTRLAAGPGDRVRADGRGHRPAAADARPASPQAPDARPLDRLRRGSAADEVHQRDRLAAGVAGPRIRGSPAPGR